jgi:integrase
MTRKLTETKISKAKPRRNSYKLSDGGGLFLFVTPTGSKLWRWTYRFRGVPKLMALGAYPDLSLQVARDLQDGLRKVLKSGTDPMAIRKAEKSLKKPAPIITRVELVEDEKWKRIVRTTPIVNSFSWVEQQWFEQWKQGKSPRHVQQVEQRVEDDIIPKLGNRPIAEIEAPEVVEVALAIEKRGAVDLAHRSLHTMGQIFRFGIAKGFNRRNPAADIKSGDFLKGLDPRNFARIEARELPDLMWKIEHYSGLPVTRVVIKLMVRTFLRTSELILAPWSEFSFRGQKLMDMQWRIPAERMKMPTPHIVPLSRQVRVLLQELRGYTGETQWLFPNVKDVKQCMSKNTILNALEAMGYKGKMTGHGFRGLASTILHEQGYEDDHIEIQLAHQERNSTKAAYNYAKYLEPRAKMMQDWSDFLDQQLALAHS